MPNPGEMFIPGQAYVGQGPGIAMGNQIRTPGFFPGFDTIVTEGAKYLVNLATQSSSTASTAAAYVAQNGQVTPNQINCPPGYRMDRSGNCCKTRRRRRKLLTCGDKADIAFLHGQLGGGQLGRAAISALLARRC